MRPHPRAAATPGFLALPAGPAIAFLASAACLLGGVAALISPGLRDADGVDQRLWAHAALGAYWVALFGLALLLERWRRANPDAVGLLALIALFAVAATVTLDLIAVDVPWTALGCAVAGFGLAAVMYRVLCARVIGAGGRWFAIGLALLLGDDASAPVALALHARLAAAPVEPIVAWRPGFVAALAGVAALVAAAERATPEPREIPAVRRQAMRWSLALIVVAATAVHQWSLDHIHSVDLTPRDWAAAVGLAALLVARLRSAWWGRSVAGEVFAALAAPGWAAACALAAQAHDAPHWAAPWDVIVVAVVVARVAWRRRCVALALAGAVGVVVAVACGDGTRLDASLLVGGCAMILAVVAIARRLPEVGLASVLAGTAAAAFALRHALGGERVAHAVAFVAGAALHAFAGVWTRRFANAAVLGGMAMLLAAVESPPWMQTLVVAACALSCGAVAWRRRSRAPLAPLLIPAGIVAPRLLPRDPAWAGIAAAFALLAGGGWWARRRAVAARTSERDVAAPVTPTGGAPRT